VRVLHVEVRHERYLDEFVVSRVGVDRLRNRVDQLDDPLGQEVAGSGLAAEDERPLRNRQLRVLLEAVVERDEVVSDRLISWCRPSVQV
jgi:hypothetical protein